MSNKHWPRFMKRGSPEKGDYEERPFASPESVPEGEGWEFITPAAPTGEAVAAGDSARLAQRVAELARDKADLAADLLDAENRLTRQAEFNERASAYASGLEAFAKDMANIEGAPPAVVERVEALLASSPYSDSVTTPLSGEGAAESTDGGKGRGRAKKPN